ncbi:uncharacterized protein LOC130656072 [Hydractinia symbiolongicarpus]|uniref:uncharacterized protein LOC130656072 n=1 Tax=Hydractinia symbiolongicarpus TaxID=13093 RepID=UPI0025509184|nr:uncharacterized protein LOC130656072 [Hydractinia symbiolongicarpus]
MYASMFFTILFIMMQSYTYATKCNGFEELCDLTIEQVSLAGTHNSGAGFDGDLYHHWWKSGGRLALSVDQPKKTVVYSCWWRNQDKSFYAQLDLGIRYFDIDTCWEDHYEPNSAWICHADAYAGSIEKMITQIDRWMNEDGHENEVIVIHFNRDFAIENSDKTARDIIQQLERKWIHSNSSKVAIQPSKNATLRSAVNQNKRIYIIMHDGLSNHNYRNWALSHKSVGYTWIGMSYFGSNYCRKLVEEMGQERCEAEAAIHNFVRYDLYLSPFPPCNTYNAELCNKLINEGRGRCFSGTKIRGKTVNFFVVDYADTQVIEATKKQNIRNIEMYLGKIVTE